MLALTLRLSFQQSRKDSNRCNSGNSQNMVMMVLSVRKAELLQAIFMLGLKFTLLSIKAHVLGFHCLPHNSSDLRSRGFTPEIHEHVLSLCHI